jgi:3-deoxy-D-manno-octulosonate 8-phosphate phosphatase KdsC-like HAD superfamily phosphatase
MKHGKLCRRYILSKTRREKNRRKLAHIFKKIKRAVPGAKVSSDQQYREFDLSVDYCEDVPRLSGKKIAQITDIFLRNGATVKLSSIHINGWIGAYDKSQMIDRFCREHLKKKTGEVLAEALFFGDSPNDAPNFKLFPYSVGVANIKNFLSRMEAHPTYITKEPGGLGFAEAIHMILKKRENLIITPSPRQI